MTSLTTMPYQRAWLDKLQEIQLKMEVAGTSRIEGADFTDRELAAAMDPNATPEQLATRSQRQAHAAGETYRWISSLEPDRPIDETLIFEVHSRIVRGCDDDHCEPGVLRRTDFNVLFGIPSHRGSDGGAQCERDFRRLIRAVQQEFRGHDQLIQALAFHYHMAAMHPFMDGNGRTARAVEALLLQRAGLRDTAFIAMSNYYYDEKNNYLAALTETRAREHDLTPFLVFGLKGISTQCRRLFEEIRRHMQRALFRNTMFDLFDRLQTPRSRVIKQRQIGILKVLLGEEGRLTWPQFHAKCWGSYGGLKSPGTALGRDLAALRMLGAIQLQTGDATQWWIAANLEWPSKITETEFFKLVKQMPRAKTHTILP